MRACGCSCACVCVFMYACVCSCVRAGVDVLVCVCVHVCVRACIFCVIQKLKIDIADTLKPPMTRAFKSQVERNDVLTPLAESTATQTQTATQPTAGGKTSAEDSNETNNSNRPVSPLTQHALCCTHTATQVDGAGRTAGCLSAAFFSLSWTASPPEGGARPSAVTIRSQTVGYGTQIIIPTPAPKHRDSLRYHTLYVWLG